MNKVLFISINFLLILSSLFFMTDLRAQAVFGVIQLITCLFYVYKKAPIKISVGVIFLAMLYVFHSGYSVEILLTGEPLSFIASRDISEKTFAKAQLFTQISIFLISLAYSRTVVKASNFTKVNIRDVSPTPFVLLFFISLPIFIAASLLKIQAASSEGYAESWVVDKIPFFHYFGMFINLCTPVATILCLFYRKNKKMLMALALFIVVFGTYIMLSGHRITAISQIITLIIVYYGAIGDLKKKTALALLAVGFAFVAFLPLITAVRSSGVTYNALNAAYEWQQSGISDNSLDASLKEYGFTIYSLVYPMEYAGKNYDYHLGLTYLTSPIGLSPVVPEVIDKADWFRESRIFIDAFPSSVRFALGGSCLGELYSNFWWLGCLFSVFIGFLIRTIDNILLSIKRTEKISFVSILAILWIPVVIMWVRGYFYPFISFIYIFVYVLWRFAQKRARMGHSR